MKGVDTHASVAQCCGTARHARDFRSRYSYSAIWSHVCSPLYRVCGVPNIFGTEHVIKNILHIYILSSGVYYNILSTSESYYKIEFVYL